MDGNMTCRNGHVDARFLPSLEPEVRATISIPDETPQYLPNSRSTGMGDIDVRSLTLACPRTREKCLRVYPRILMRRSRR